MMTAPAPALQPHPSRVLWVAAVVAVVLPLEVVARTAAYPQGWAVALGRSSLLGLSLVALGGVLAARWWRSGATPAAVVAVLVGLVALRSGGAIVLDAPWLDPLGRGQVVPAATPWPIAIAVVAGASGGGLLAHRVRRVPPWWVVLGAWVVLLAIIGSFDAPVVSAVGSLVGALLLAVSVADGRRAVAPATSDGAVLLGTFLSGAALAGTVAWWVLHHYPERVSSTDGVVTTLGPLFAPALWVSTLVAAVGIVLAAIIHLVAPATGTGDTPRWQRPLLTPARFVPLITAVAFLFRVWALEVVSTARRDSGDPFFYHVTANLLARGRGFEEPLNWIAYGDEIASALHGPGFPAALAVVSRFGGLSYIDHQWASVLFGLPQVVFAMLLAHRLAGRRVAVLAGVVCVVYPNLWLTDGSLFVEGLMAGFTMAATWAMYCWIDRPRAVTAAGIGALIALAALTRGEALLLIPLFFGGVMLVRRPVPWRQRCQHAAIGTAAAVATLAPWMIYNQPRFEVFVPLSTNSNEVLFYANCDDVYSGPLIGFWSFACQERYRAEFGDPPGDQAQQAVYWRKLAIEYIREHRDQVPKVLAARVGRQWELFRPGQTISLSVIEGRDATSTRIGQWMFYAMMPLAVAGSVAMRRRRQLLLPMWSHAIAVTATALYAYGTLRFRAPWEPVMVVLAAIGVVFLFDLWRRRVAALTDTDRAVEVPVA